ncbi:uncharacterized protein AMSG_05090 [Thecamonas trahens ATCC 50062]|uniref:Uncharacterized protein n=1 Tax=Thecamonas trahens ATCC 50062 TaxID=461836 RepID=A0A0L0DA65_THETB|nr:hypothetical protein AMSG_05090 [Thecamonas trahens ATCC 50062]KNC49120.1 hypothetical protein AMSG_05090 [Thecamonas trahens ATCC 50062]|eukprot:XP_013758148.1 hypothetical protein AMSG_05090 [Thecamonas trahens ATCC 50062]
MAMATVTAEDVAFLGNTFMEGIGFAIVLFGLSVSPLTNAVSKSLLPTRLFGAAAGAIALLSYLAWASTSTEAKTMAAIVCTFYHIQATLIALNESTAATRPAVIVHAALASAFVYAFKDAWFAQA